MSRDRPPGRSPGATLSRYVAREIWRPVCFALIGLTLIILIQDLLGFSDLVINRGVGMREVLGIAFAQAVPVAARMFPFALLVGTLVGLGRLGADREILVLEASGISASRLIGPVARFALAMTALSLLLSLLAAPAANRALDAQRCALTALGMGAAIMACFATLFVLARDHLPALYGVEPEDGSVLWDMPLPHFRGMHILTPKLWGATIFPSP